jgi:hypothetical protein
MNEFWEPVAGPEARTHGAAWSAFYAAIPARRVSLSTAELRHDWLMFLAGWKAKCDQRKGFGKR